MKHTGFKFGILFRPLLTFANTDKDEGPTGFKFGILFPPPLILADSGIDGGPAASLLTGLKRAFISLFSGFLSVPLILFSLLCFTEVSSVVYYTDVQLLKPTWSKTTAYLCYPFYLSFYNRATYVTKSEPKSYMYILVYLGIFVCFEGV